MIAAIVSSLLGLVPGLGPFGPLLSILVTVLLQAEVKRAYPIVRDLVHQAEGDKTLTTGIARFEWVLPRALDSIAEAQIKVGQDIVRMLIENEVQVVKAVKTAVS